MFQGLTLWFAVAAKVLNFVSVGARAYLESDEGRELWKDVLQAYETAVNADIDGDGIIGETPVYAEPVEPAFRAAATAETKQKRPTRGNETNRSVFDERD